MVEIFELQERLKDYLGASLKTLAVLASGWETTVYEFAINAEQAHQIMPTGRPLVLRVYHGPEAAAKVSREFSVIRHLGSLNFPVPTTYAYEPDASVLGAPFQIMQRLEGSPLLELGSFRHAFATFTRGFLSFVRIHTELHRLNPQSAGLDSFGQASIETGDRDGRTLLDRMLATISGRVEAGPLPWLGPALQWAKTEAGRFRDRGQSVLHLDYHPLNALAKGGRITGIVDWVSTEGGDRHLDVATTATIMSTWAMENPLWMRDNWAGNSLRRGFTSLYIMLYHAMAPIDFTKLRYYQGVAALFRLSTLGMMRRRGAESVGYRAEAAREVTPSVLQLLSRYAARKTRVPVVPEIE